MKRLPIEVVQGTVPPRFTWTYHPPGARLSPVKCEGAMAATIEASLVDLIDLCWAQQEEIAALSERLARAEAKSSEATPIQMATAVPTPTPQPARKRR